MEGKTVSGITLLLMVLFGQLSCQVESQTFDECYEAQFLNCLLNTNKIFKCAFKGVEQCIIHSIGGGQHEKESGKHYECKSQCAMQKCTHISTRRAPGAKKVGRCVKSCSDGCVDNS